MHLFNLGVNVEFDLKHHFIEFGEQVENHENLLVRCFDELCATCVHGQCVVKALYQCLIEKFTFVDIRGETIVHVKCLI